MVKNIQALEEQVRNLPDVRIAALLDQELRAAPLPEGMSLFTADGEVLFPLIGQPERMFYLRADANGKSYTYGVKVANSELHLLRELVARSAHEFQNNLSQLNAQVS